MRRPRAPLRWSVSGAVPGARGWAKAPPTEQGRVHPSCGDCPGLCLEGSPQASGLSLRFCLVRVLLCFGLGVPRVHMLAGQGAGGVPGGGRRGTGAAA